jgi:hypothetical protein
VTEKKSGSFHPKNLVVVDLDRHYAHVLHLMDLANQGVPEAGAVARRALTRYFERVEESLI